MAEIAGRALPLPVDVATLAEDASVEIARFDAADFLGAFTGFARNRMW